MDAATTTAAAICARCGAAPALKACPQCRVAFCGADCFKQAWSRHRLRHAPGAADGTDPRFEGFNFTGDLRPVKPLAAGGMRPVPEAVLRPDYALDGIPRSEKQMREVLRPGKIQVLPEEDQEKLKEVCSIGRLVLDAAASACLPGYTTDEVDRVAHNTCVENDCYPSPLNYRGFPKSCCTSVNEVICHGIPDQYELQEGDICNIDITCYSRDGFHGDLNETYFVGEMPPPDDTRRRLVQTTYDALWNAIDTVKPGLLYRDIGTVIEKHCRANKFQVVRSYCGHGIHRLFHTTPNIPHYGKNKAAGVARAGHAFTIEPMVNVGVWQDQTWPDDWTSVTKDGKLSAQFEHTLLVTDEGVEVLTARTDKSPTHHTVTRSVPPSGQA